jgi:hypothetical protein
MSSPAMMRAQLDALEFVRRIAKERFHASSDSDWNAAIDIAAGEIRRTTGVVVVCFCDEKRGMRCEPRSWRCPGEAR